MLLAFSLVLLFSSTSIAAPQPRGDRVQHVEQLETPSHPKRVPDLFQPSVPDGLTRALTEGRISAARYALERVRSLFDLAGVRSRFGSVGRPDPRSATLLMRDLVVRLDELSPAQRSAAGRILARPTDGAADPGGDGYTTAEATPFCTSHTCVHYVTTTVDAPNLADLDVSGVPDYVETVSSVLETVWDKEVNDLGFRPPKSDATSPNNGGSALLDVYLVDIGDENGLYGYCVADDPNTDPSSGYEYYDLSGYCVLDDDYSSAQYPYANPMNPLRVTAAHEFFHAVQFAYDWLEDAWLMEGTATWIERGLRQHQRQSPVPRHQPSL
jgi:hypothetical protein